jgi:hypothetical protein
MREVVVGRASTDARYDIASGVASSGYGFVQIEVWFRIPIPAADDPTTPRPGRREIYAAMQRDYSPAAPGDYRADDGTGNPGAHFTEIAEFQSGAYTELPSITVPIDPRWHNADVQAAIQSTSPSVNGSILAWLLHDRKVKVLDADDHRYGLLGTALNDDGTWAPGRS